MKLIIAAAAAAGLLITSAVAYAGPGKDTPGHMMQRHGSVAGHPGASGYAPGHRKHHRETVGYSGHHRHHHHREYHHHRHHHHHHH